MMSSTQFSPPPLLQLETWDSSRSETCSFAGLRTRARMHMHTHAHTFQINLLTYMNTCQKEFGACLNVERQSSHVNPRGWRGSRRCGVRCALTPSASLSYCVKKLCAFLRLPGEPDLSALQKDRSPLCPGKGRFREAQSGLDRSWSGSPCLSSMCSWLPCVPAEPVPVRGPSDFDHVCGLSLAWNYVLTFLAMWLALCRVWAHACMQNCVIFMGL
jgi:hypothetical protein